MPAKSARGRNGGRKGRGRNGHRGRDVDDRKTKIRNSNLSREQLISRTSPPSTVSTATSLPLLPAAAVDTVVSPRRKPPLSPTIPHTDARASHVPSSWDSYGKWQADRVFNRRNRIVELEGRAFGKERENNIFFCTVAFSLLSRLSPVTFFELFRS